MTSPEAERYGEGYDALLLLSFGGPEGPQDVMPFLRNVTRGRGIPEQRLAQVAEHYAHFGGVSPINEQNRTLLAALETEFARHSVPLRLYWGNRNWHPMLADTLGQMRADGVRRALVFATGATSSYSSCRQYREDMAAAAAAVGDGAPQLVKLRHYYHHPGFIEANAAGLRDALASLPVDLRADARLIFTAHSIPLAMERTASPTGFGYTRDHAMTARLVAQAVRGPDAVHDLVWQSRSGPPHVPWLEPDINDHLRTIAAQTDTKAVVVIPTGFVSDHLEVRWDLDYEAAATAADLGLAFARARTAGTHPAFVTMVRHLVQEHLDGEPPLVLNGGDPRAGWQCPPGCCALPARPPGSG